MNDLTLRELAVIDGGVSLGDVAAVAEYLAYYFFTRVIS